MMSFTVTRTFHPIGEGAFYSECFEHGGERFIMIYDCGSSNSNIPPKSLCKEIKDSFTEDQYDTEGRLIVDILFLSHFHNDHINGLSLLAPRKVVCPLVSDDDILMLQVMDEFQEEWNIAAMRNPAILFSNNPIIIRVDPLGPEESFEVRGQIVNDDSLSNRIQSGTKIAFNHPSANLTGLWCFIPYNFHYQGRLEEFKEKLSDSGLAYEDLKNDPSAFIKIHKQILKQICNSFTGKTNDQSLILYSGPAAASTRIMYLGNDYASCNRYCKFLKELNDIEPWLFEYLVRDCIFNHKKYFRLFHRYRILEKPAIIYYGDITLREKLVSSLTYGLISHMSYVGTIQLPHHGSDRSFHESVLYYYLYGRRQEYDKFSVLYVMSAGSKSKTHPGKNVLTTLSYTPQMYGVVTDKRASSITERWLIECK